MEHCKVDWLSERIEKACIMPLSPVIIQVQSHTYAANYETYYLTAV